MSEVNVFCFITNLCVIALSAVLFAILPALTRKAYLFGVKVPESAQELPEAKALKKRYITAVLLGMSCIMALTVAQFLLLPDLTVAATSYFPLLIIAVQLLAYVPMWKKAVMLKQENNWQMPGITFAETRSSFSRGNLSAVPWFYYIISFIIIVVSIVIALVKYPSLPDPFPTHFNAEMVADAWQKKTIGVVLFVPLINLSMLVLMVVSAIAIVKAKLQVSPENPALSFAQHRVYRRLMGHSCGMLTIGVAVGMTLLFLSTILQEVKVSFWLSMLFMLLPCVPIIWVSVRVGQGGCKLKPEITEADAAAAGYSLVKVKEAFPGRGDDKYWALGMFYHNPGDPAIIVEDRFGTNIGFNYSRLGVKIGAAVFLLAFIGMYVWMTPLLLSIK